MCSMISLLKQYFGWYIFNLKPFEIFMYQFLRAIWFVGFDTYKADTSADSIIWEVFEKQSAGIHTSSQLIHYYLYHMVHTCIGQSRDICAGHVHRRDTILSTLA